MSKSLFGGGVALTGALLLSSLLFNVDTSTAETLSPPDQRNIQAQPESTPNEGTRVPIERTQPGGVSASVVLPPATRIPNTALRDAPPTVEKQASSNLVLLNPLTTAQTYSATAYVLRGRTSSGRMVSRGLIAADRRLLPLGTRVRLDAGAYSGEYLVADQGSAVRGRRIDIWMPDHREAIRFGRRPVKLTVLSGAAKGRTISVPAATTKH